MIRKIRLTERAESDLAELWRQIAQDNPIAADKLVVSILNRCELLGGFPHLGREIGIPRPGDRRLVFKRYVILYRVTERRISILRVIGGYRDLDALLGEG